MAKKYAYFVADGPYPTQDRWGDEYPVWVVAGCDNDDCEVKVVEYSSRSEAIRIAAAAAKKYNVEFVNEAGLA